MFHVLYGLYTVLFYIYYINFFVYYFCLLCIDKREGDDATTKLERYIKDIILRVFSVCHIKHYTILYKSCLPLLPDECLNSIDFSFNVLIKNIDKTLNFTKRQPMDHFISRKDSR